MKEKFLEPELEVIHFSVEDVITASSGITDPSDNYDPDELPPIIVPQS